LTLLVFLKYFLTLLVFLKDFLTLLVFLTSQTNNVKNLLGMFFFILYDFCTFQLLLESGDMTVHGCFNLY
jgi:hypothetical protein